MPDRLANAAALSCLATAHGQAVQADRDPWQFALEIYALGRLGARHHELRWLVSEGLVEHRLEITTPSCQERRFQPVVNLSLPIGTCFVLTEKGAAWLRQQPPQNGHSTLNGHSAQPASVAEPSPHWDPQHRVLTFAGEILKSFRVPAASQEAILSAFEAAEWPPCIADPLANKSDQEPRQRLANAIKGLNRSQTVRHIRFFGDGTGQRICWKRIHVSRHR